MDRELRGGTVGLMSRPRRSAPGHEPKSDRREVDAPAGPTAAKVPVIGRTRTRLFALVVLLLGATVLNAVFGIPQLLRLRLESRTQEVDLFHADDRDSFVCAISPPTSSPSPPRPRGSR